MRFAVTGVLVLVLVPVLAADFLPRFLVSGRPPMDLWYSANASTPSLEACQYVAHAARPVQDSQVVFALPCHVLGVVVSLPFDMVQDGAF